FCEVVPLYISPTTIVQSFGSHITVSGPATFAAGAEGAAGAAGIMDNRLGPAPNSLRISRTPGVAWNLTPDFVTKFSTPLEPLSIVSDSIPCRSVIGIGGFAAARCPLCGAGDCGGEVCWPRCGAGVCGGGDCCGAGGVAPRCWGGVCA